MSDKWMEMKQPMLLMQSHNINTFSLVVFGYSLEIFYTRRTLARGRMKKIFIALPFSSVPEELTWHRGRDQCRTKLLQGDHERNPGSPTPLFEYLIVELYVQASQRNWPDYFSLMLLIF